MKVSEALHILESNMAPAQWTGVVTVAVRPLALQLICEYAVMGRQQQIGKSSITVCLTL